MNNTLLSYRVEPFDPEGHRFRITLTIPAASQTAQRLSLPAWIPGSYLIRDFSRQIETLSARQGRRTLQARKIDNHTWELPPGEGESTVQYVVYAWDLSVRGAHFDQRHAFFNGTSLFLRVHGMEHLPHSVDLAPPPGLAHWKVYTSLPTEPGREGARKHGFGRYRAPDYDALIDHPVEMGTGVSIRFAAHGAEHEMVFTDAPENIDLERIAEDTRRICEAQIAFFEPRTKRAPFLDSAERYVFMTQVTPNGYGGLEHRASTALMTARKDLPLRGQTDMHDGYRSFLGLVSHEYFHTWHVKRIKPAAFVPYTLDRPNLTRLLWVFEGFTSYYDDLFLVRSGVIDERAYLQLLGKTIDQVASSAGRHKQSVGDSSFDAWTRYYKQDENSGNALVSYYTKGALVALLLDLVIRTTTADSKSLDDVMRLLWTRYGRSFFDGAPRGVPEDAMSDIVAEATGVDVSRLLHTYVDGTAELPLAPWLSAHGIDLHARPGSVPTSLEAKFRQSGDGLNVLSVVQGGAAHRAGLSAGDTMVALDDWRIGTQAELDDLLSRRRPGARVHIHAFRQHTLMRFEARLQAARPTVRLSRSI